MCLYAVKTRSLGKGSQSSGGVDVENVKLHPSDLAS